MANLLTLIRLLAAGPFGLAMHAASPAAARAAGLLLVVAIVTDLLDGRIARERRTTTAQSRAFDHVADFLFVMAGLLGAASRGALPVWLPLCVGAAFLQYVLDSYALHGAGVLRPNPLGRVNGILYFVPLAGDTLARLGATGLAGPARWIAWALVATTLLSMADRWWRLPRSSRRAHGSRPGERPDRSAR